MIDDDALKKELLRLDILLRRKQLFWETPRALLLIVATTAAIAGVLGWKFSGGTSTLNVHLDAPLVVKGGT